MRTTVRLPDDLMRAIKRLAIDTHRSMTGVIADALRSELARHQEGSERSPVDLPTDRGDGLLPGVDLDNTAALLDLMEEPGPRST